MANFYFTFGSEGHPYKGGWIIIKADNISLAIDFFTALYPSDGYLKCSDYYTEKAFKQTKMYHNGNLGEYCHRVVEVTIKEYAPSASSHDADEETYQEVNHLKDIINDENSQVNAVHQAILNSTFGGTK